VLDVSEALGHKQAAIAAHASQTTALIDDDPTGFRLPPCGRLMPLVLRLSFAPTIRGTIPIRLSSDSSFHRLHSLAPGRAHAFAGRMRAAGPHAVVSGYSPWTAHQQRSGKRQDACRAQTTLFRRAAVPRDMPRGIYDLVIVSELAYYIPAHQLAQLANRIYAMLAPRGAVVVLNHRRPFDDAAVLPALAHRRLRRLFEQDEVCV
jgi:hypothetical protein